MFETISAMSRSRSLERAWAGLGKTTVTETGWSWIEVGRCRAYCGDTMAHWGYPMLCEMAGAARAAQKNGAREGAVSFW